MSCRLVPLVLLAVLALAACAPPPGEVSAGGTAIWSVPPTTRPSSTVPPATRPPATVPPATVPPATVPPATGPTPTRTSSPLPTVRGSADGGRTWFRACRRDRAAPGTTNLRPRRISGVEPKPFVYDLKPYSGRLIIERVMTLPLPGGLLGSGNGYEAAYSENPLVRVADRTVTAEVNQAVIVEGQDRRVAFVELRLSPVRPVSWAEVPQLGIVTDGGDGGFYSADAGSGPADQDFEDYVEAFYPKHNSASGNVCVLRGNEDQARPNGFLFSTGMGDGGYPTYLGRAANGQVVSVVSYGFMVPWRLSGLPGSPPADVVEETAKRRAGG